jgi:hypothetical protein
MDKPCSAAETARRVEEVRRQAGGHLTVAQLRRRQRVYGFDSVTTRQPYLEALGEVIAAGKLGDGQDTGHVGMP